MKICKPLLIVLSLLFTPIANALTVSNVAFFDFSNSDIIETSLTSVARYENVTSLNYLDIPTFDSSLGILTGVSIELDSRRRDTVEVNAVDLVPDVSCYLIAGVCVPISTNDTGGEIDLVSRREFSIVDRKNYGGLYIDERITRDTRVVSQGCIDDTPDLLFYVSCSDSKRDSGQFDEIVDITYLGLASFMDTSTSRPLFFEFSSRLSTDLECIELDGDVCDGIVSSRLYGSITINYTYDEFPLDSDQDGIADSVDACPFDATNSCEDVPVTAPGFPSVSVPEVSSIYLLAFGLLGLFGSISRKV